MIEAAISIILLDMKKRNSLLKAFLITTLMVMIFGLWVTPGETQFSTVLSVEPSRLQLPLGNRVRLELEVADGVNVNAFDLMINYDFDRLRLLDWAHGGYLTSLTCTNLIRQPGVFELACNQPFPEEVDGDGVLLILDFEAIGLGFPDVTVTEAAFLDADGDISYPQTRHAVVEVTNDPTYTSTPPNTSTVTQTSTSTPTPSSTFTPLVTSTSTITPALSPTEGGAITETASPTITQTMLPGEETATAMVTETAGAAGLTQTAIFQQRSSDTPQPDVLSTPTPQIPGVEDSIGDESSSADLVRNLWLTTLWGVLVLAVVFGLGLLIYTIRQRRSRGDEEDLLL